LLNSIIYAIQSLIKYLCESINNCVSNKVVLTKSDLKDNESLIEEIKLKNGYLIENCIDLLDCVDRILQIRLLKYYSHLNSSLIDSLKNLIDFMFINLTDLYPLLAVKLTKLLQILNK
jgi:hypothetical protein